MKRAIVGLFAAACAVTMAQYDSRQPVTPELILIGRVQSVVREMLVSMPNFTCVQTIERSQRPPNTKKYQLVDTLRLEVALVEGRELFAWPGSPKFEEDDVTKLVSGNGAIGSGDFALHAKSIFLTGQAKFRYLGQEEIEGRLTHKFHFRVPIDSSRYVMKLARAEGAVGYQGHVWHDKTTLDLIRIEMVIDEIPSHIPLKEGFKRIDYARVPIGGQDYNLPVAMDMTLTGLAGDESRNKAVFSRCRQYTGQSTLTFEDPPPDTERRPIPVTVTLPSNLNVSLKLAETLDLGKAAKGDPVRMAVSKDAVRDGQVLLPKGARVEFRLDHVFCRDIPFSHCYVALVPVKFEFENKSGVFRADLETPRLEQGISTIMVNVRPEFRMPPAELGMASRGSSVILLRGNRPKVASGYSTVWRTLERRGDEEP